MISVRFQHGERLIGAVMLALGAGVVLGGLAMPVASGGVPGAGFFPLVTGTMLAVCAIALIARPAVAPDANENNGRVSLFPSRVVATILVLAGLAVVFERTSIIVTLSGLLAGLHWIYARGPWWRSVLFGVAGAFTAWVLFVYLLAVPLPGF